MDLLREHIIKLPLEELPDGHAKRFSQKLEVAFPLKKLVHHKFFYLAYVVAAMLVLGLSLVFLTKNTDEKHRTELILSLENNEIVETEQYLKGEIDKKLVAIQSLIINSEHTVMIEDIKEIDINLDKLKEDYEQSPGDQRIIEAVLNTYMMKIETLDIMMNIIQNKS